MKRRCFLFVIILFWAVCATIFLFRVKFDLQTWYHGNTIEVRSPVLYHYDYLLHFPKRYHDFGNPYPLIIYLHGAGETGKDIRQLKKLDMSYFFNQESFTPEFQFFVVTPVTPKGGWEPNHIIALLDALLADQCFRYRIDPNRIYLTGYSMGGFGTFDTACAFPDRFAAIVPLAGGGDPGKAEKLMTVPTWAFHGDKDDIVSCESTEKMIHTMQELHHPNVRMTLLPGFGHAIPPSVYARSDLYQWLLKQKRIHP